jgi:hypothetical protein
MGATVAADFGTAEGGIGARTLFGSKACPRVTGGAVISVDEGVESSERVAGDCARAAGAATKHKMTASAGQNRPAPGAGA